ncbi:UNVERIFIED_CONTAM: hypothetical protein FKN15_045157 [Acipenser sinensis]
MTCATSQSASLFGLKRSNVSLSCSIQSPPQQQRRSKRSFITQLVCNFIRKTGPLLNCLKSSNVPGSATSQPIRGLTSAPYRSLRRWVPLSLLSFRVPVIRDRLPLEGRLSSHNPRICFRYAGSSAPGMRRHRRPQSATTFLSCLRYAGPQPLGCVGIATLSQRPPFYPVFGMLGPLPLGCVGIAALSQ